MAWKIYGSMHPIQFNLKVVHLRDEHCIFDFYSESNVYVYVSFLFSFFRTFLFICSNELCVDCHLIERETNPAIFWRIKGHTKVIWNEIQVNSKSFNMLLWSRIILHLKVQCVARYMWAFRFCMLHSFEIFLMTFSFWWMIDSKRCAIAAIVYALELMIIKLNLFFYFLADYYYCTDICMWLYLFNFSLNAFIKTYNAWFT